MDMPHTVEYLDLGKWSSKGFFKWFFGKVVSYSKFRVHKRTELLRELAIIFLLRVKIIILIIRFSDADRDCWSSCKSHGLDLEVCNEREEEQVRI